MFSFFREVPKFARRAGSDVGLSIRKKHNPIHPFLVQELANLDCTFADSREESRSASGFDLRNLLADGRFVRQLCGRNEDLDRRVIGDDRNDVVGTKPLDRLDGSAASFFDFAALHRSGLVEHDGNVHRSPGGKLTSS